MIVGYNFRRYQRAIEVVNVLTAEISYRRDYPGRHEYVKACLLTSWGERAQGAGATRGVPPQGADFIFEKLSPKAGTIQGVRWIASLGAVAGFARHQIKLIPPQYLYSYVKRGNNNTADTEALYKAMSRPTIRFVLA